MLKRKSDGSFEIDVLAMLKALWNRIWAIIIAAIIFAIGGFCYSNYFLTPQYQSSVLFYVNNSGKIDTNNYRISTGELSAAQSLVNTYMVVLTSRTCLNEVIARGNYNFSYATLRGKISTSAVENTEIFRVTITDIDATRAADIANTIAEVLPDKISDIVDGSSVRVVDYAVVLPGRTYPSRMKYTLLGMAIGIGISVVGILILEFLDDLIHDEDYLTNNYKEYTILASIPDLARGSGRYGYGGKNRGYAYGRYGKATKKEMDEVVKEAMSDVKEEIKNEQ